MSHALSHPTPQSDRVPLREKLALGLGRVMADGSTGAIHILLNPIFNIVLGMNPALLSTIVFLQRLWDAITDPIFGHYSDNFRSRWGRRRPLIAAGALPTALFFAALWWIPPGLGQWTMFWLLLSCFVVFHLAHTLYSMPYIGLVLEATGDYHERTRVAALVLVFSYGFQVLCQWLFPLTQLAIFDSPASGLRWVTGGCAVLFFITALAPVFFCKERNYATISARQPKIRMRDGLRAAMTNPPLMRLIIARTIASFCYTSVSLLGLYMNTYYVFGGDVKRGAWFYGFLGSAYMVAAIAGTALLYPFLSRRFGKRRTVQIAALILVAGCLFKFVVYQETSPWLQFVVFLSNGASISGINLMAVSMLGDIADYEEWKHGTRNEAFLSSIYAWFEKTGGSLGSLVSGFVLVWVGFDAKLGAQSVSTLELMKYAYIIMPMLGAAVAFYMMQTYDLDENRMAEIKSEIAGRKLIPPARPA